MELMKYGDGRGILYCSILVSFTRKDKEIKKCMFGSEYYFHFRLGLANEFKFVLK